MDARGRRGGPPETAHGGEPCQAKGHCREGAPEEGYRMEVQERVGTKKTCGVSYCRKIFSWNRGANGMDIFRPYSSLNLFRGV